jgi:NAD(P)-dependent dehydrogenase (short-subunit alcohol dehydrogenase family)
MLDEITTTGGTAIANHADLSKSEDRERASAELVEKAGAPDILINSAAVTFLSDFRHETFLRGASFADRSHAIATRRSPILRRRSLSRR